MEEEEEEELKDNCNEMTMMTSFLRQQPTMVRCIPGRGGGDFYNHDNDDNEGQ